MAERRDKEFAAKVHHVVKTGIGFKEAAARLGMSYNTFYARLREDGGTVMSAEEIRALISATGSRALVEYFLEQSPFLAVERRAQNSDIAGKNEDVTHGEIQGGAYRSVYVAAEILREVDNALKDRKIDHNDRREILDHVNEAEIALASLRTHLNGKIGPDPEK